MPPQARTAEVQAKRVQARGEKENAYRVPVQVDRREVGGDGRDGDVDKMSRAGREHQYQPRRTPEKQIVERPEDLKFCEAKFAEIQAIREGLKEAR